MKKQEFPKLRYPINTHQLTKEDAMILLAYDMIWRAKEELVATGMTFGEEFMQDIDANLSNLGSHIETMICGGDLALRFENGEKLTQPIVLDKLK